MGNTHSEAVRPSVTNVGKGNAASAGRLTQITFKESLRFFDFMNITVRLYSRALCFNLMSFFMTCPLQYRDGKKLKPKPNYNSVDLSEVEWEDRAETVSGESRRNRSWCSSTASTQASCGAMSSETTLFLPMEAFQVQTRSSSV